MPKLISEDVEQSLRRRLEAGEWRATRRLPNERELAREYGVARNTVRAAIGRIVADGGLVRAVGRGTFLGDDAEIDASAVLRGLIGASPLDMMALRKMLEPGAAALAAAHASSAELDAIAAAHAEAAGSPEMESFERWDAELHSRVFAATRNDMLNNLHELMRLIRNQPLWREMKRRSFSAERRRRYCEEHAALVAALLRRDPEQARRAMLAHLETVTRNLTSPPAWDGAPRALEFF